MPVAVQLEAFRTSTDAVVLVDSGGKLRLVNGPASALLECDPAEVLGEPCWKILGLRTDRGDAFCSPGCRVRQSLRTNATYPRRRVLRPSCTGTDRTLEMLSFQIPEAGSGRSGVLHLMIPATLETVGPELPLPGRREMDDAGRLMGLTPRETQILEAISAGESTAAIASRLCISVATARNHVRSILQKLAVHRQLDAVLLWVSRRH